MAFELSTKEQEAVADLLADTAYPKTEPSADARTLIKLSKRLGFDDGSPTVKMLTAQLKD